MIPLVPKSSSTDANTTPSTAPHAKCCACWALKGPTFQPSRAQYHPALHNPAAQSGLHLFSHRSLVIKEKTNNNNKKPYHVSESNDTCRLPDYRTRGCSFYCLESLLPFHVPECRIPLFSSYGRRKVRPPKDFLFCLLSPMAL